MPPPLSPPIFTLNCTNVLPGLYKCMSAGTSWTRNSSLEVAPFQLGVPFPNCTLIATPLPAIPSICIPERSFIAHQRPNNSLIAGSPPDTPSGGRATGEYHVVSNLPQHNPPPPPTPNFQPNPGGQIFQFHSNLVNDGKV